MLISGCGGAGLGLRIPHIQYVLREKPAIPWFEVHSCNFLRGGLNRALLHRVARDYPLSFHGVSLNLGGTDPLDKDYLQRLKIAIDEFQPSLFSEHACFTAINGEQFHDLLPLPFTKQAVNHIADRIDEVQNYLGRTLLIENASSYFRYAHEEMTEAQFLSQVCKRSGCGLLLDINNAYVNQCNLGESIDDFMAELPLEAICEVHLAGFSQGDGYLIDTHSRPVSEEVWSYYRQFNQLCPNIPCLIEWDNDLPSFEQLENERFKAQRILDQTYSTQNYVRNI